MTDSPELSAVWEKYLPLNRFVEQPKVLARVWEDYTTLILVASSGHWTGVEAHVDSVDGQLTLRYLSPPMTIELVKAGLLDGKVFEEERKARQVREHAKKLEDAVVLLRISGYTVTKGEG